MPRRRSKTDVASIPASHEPILKKGVDFWNRWRVDNPDVKPQLRMAYLVGDDLRSANLSDADLMMAFLTDARLEDANLSRANLASARMDGSLLNGATMTAAAMHDARLNKSQLRGAKLTDAKLDKASLMEADLSGAVLDGASLYRANLSRANLTDARFPGAQMREAILTEAILEGTDLSHATLVKAVLDMATLHKCSAYQADFHDANFFHTNITQSLLMGADFSNANMHGATIESCILEQATLVETDLSEAELIDSAVYGISAWGLKLADMKKQLNLRVTPLGADEPSVTVDNVEVAQFVYLLLRNEKIRNVIDTIGKKGVLILGRFTPERKAVLDAIRNRLRDLDFVPMMFDFEKPTQRDFTETIKTLAGMSRFIVADITNPKSSPLELQATMPDYMIPFVPIIHESEQPFAMFRDLKQKYGAWVLDVLEYDSAESLVAVMKDAIVVPALEAADRLMAAKAETLRTRHVRDYQ